MDYSQLHDAQINMMVCKALGLELSSYARIIMQDDATILLSDNKTLVDYCNNPADAWPIIDKYRISIINLGEDEWGARGVADCKSKRAIHENSLRAAMIVFLMMQDAKHA
ncbi:phage protein NinX family protein [Enterobacter sp. HNGD-822]